MKLIDAEELLKNETKAKNFSPEMLVVGKGHILSAKQSNAQYNFMVELNKRIASAEKRYKEEQEDGDAVSIASTRASYLALKDARELFAHHFSPT